jgi:transketolase
VVSTTDMRTAFATTTRELLTEDPRVALVLADISVSAYLGKAIREQPDRAVNVGIMESTMVGVAAGFAMEGFHPIAHSLSPFMAERPYEQLKLDFGYQRLGGTFVGVGGSYDYAGEGGTHHAPGDVQALLAIPGMEVLVPGHGREVGNLMRSTYANGRPTYIRASAVTNAEAHDVGPGRLEVIRRGSTATVVAFGPMLMRTLEATADLDVSVVYATSLEPFDHEALAAVAGDSPNVIAVEPFYEATSAQVLAKALGHRPATYGFIGVPRRFIHDYGTWRDLDADLGLDVPGIRRAMDIALAL